MSRQRIHWDSRDLDRQHREKLARKYERIQGLRALLEMWEARPDEAGHEYILQLRAKLRSAENQLAAMTI
jgi:hypothetical protein